MIAVGRLKVVGTVLGLTALLTCTHVWGEPGRDKSKDAVKSPSTTAPADKADLDFAGEDYLEKGVQTLDDTITPIIVANIDQWLMLDNFKVPAGARVKPPGGPARP